MGHDGSSMPCAVFGALKKNRPFRAGGKAAFSLKGFEMGYSLDQDTLSHPPGHPDDTAS